MCFLLRYLARLAARLDRFNLQLENLGSEASSGKKVNFETYIPSHAAGSGDDFAVFGFFPSVVCINEGDYNP